MAKHSFLSLWLKGIRAPFLVLSVILVSIGGAAAFYDHFFNPYFFLLTLLGVVLAHMSVNLFNEYSDWKTGIDSHTVRTPFSGGSGNIQSGAVRPAHVKLAATASLIAAFLIGLYLAGQSGWGVLVLMALGGFTIVKYTDLLARCMLGEAASGITLGSCVVIGAYYVQTGDITAGVVWASIPPGILTMLLLFLNEFPDAEADEGGGRRHLVIVLGKPTAALVYSCLLAIVYLTILVGAFACLMPKTVLISLATSPLAYLTIRRVLIHHDSLPQMLPALGMNVIIVLGTDALMAVGFLLG